MGFHHTAFATRDLMGTHKFYTESMGFNLAKTVVGPTENGGWAKHVFYEISADCFVAFWDLHDEHIPDTWSAAISTGQGLPIWTNHLAFRANSLDDLVVRRQRWLDHGHDVTEVDHGFCRSIYSLDPNGILVEFCVTTKGLTQQDAEEALRLLHEPHPPTEAPKEVIFHRPKKAAATAA